MPGGRCHPSGRGRPDPGRRHAERRAHGVRRRHADVRRHPPDPPAGRRLPRVSMRTGRPDPSRVAPRKADGVGVLLTVVSATLFGAVVVLGKVATRPGGLPVPSLLAYRFGLATVVLAALLAALRLPLTPARGEATRLAALGMFLYAGDAAMFFTALRHGSVAAVTLLFYTYPVCVSMLAWVLGRGRPGWLLGGALASAVAGAAIVAIGGRGVSIDGLGAFLAIGAALSISLYFVGAEAVLRRTNSLTGAMWVSAWAALGLAAFALATGAASVPHGGRQWALVLGMGVFTSGAFVCLFGGLRRLGAVRTAILSTAEPLAAVTLAAIFLDEVVRAGTLVGGALIVVGAIAASVARGQTRSEPPIH
ncbi:MAG: DMT family transporter [Actinobacteria bacterium]|nr:MAG: DMT family transporter [Actinomycetota bacterium]